MPSSCHWARSCPEIVIQPWSLSHSSEKQLAYSLPGSSKRRLSTGGHKVLVCDRQKLSVCFPLFSIQIVQLTPHSSGHLPLLAQWEGINALLCLFLCVMITPRLLGGVKEGYLSECPHFADMRKHGCKRFSNLKGLRTNTMGHHPCCWWSGVTTNNNHMWCLFLIWWHLTIIGLPW